MMGVTLMQYGDHHWNVETFGAGYGNPQFGGCADMEEECFVFSAAMT